MRLFSLATLLMLCSVFAFAGQSASIASERSRVSFETNYLFDPTGQLSFEQVRSSAEEDWNVAENNVVGFHYLQPEYYQANRDAQIWVRLNFADDAPDEKLWLELMPNVGHDGRIATFEEGEWRWRDAVGRPDSDMSEVPSRFLTFTFNPQTQGSVAYIKLNTRQIFNFFIQAKPLQQMISEKVWHTLFFGFLAGALLLALVYNGVIGYMAKEKVYVYYAIYVLFVIIYITAVAGYVRMLFPCWEGAPTLTNASVLTVMGSVILFVRELLDTKLILAKLDRVLQVTQAAIVLGVVVITFGPNHVGYYVSEAFGLTVPVLVFMVAVLAVRKQHPLAKYFLIAWLLIISIAAYWSWMWLGLIEPSQELVNMLLIGIATEVLLLALVLGLKFSTLKAETELLTRDKKKLKFLSEVDELTGVLNRRGFLSRVSALVRNHKKFVWLALDIDHFKRFNDEYGHLVGDQLLAQMGQLLQQQGRSDDIAGRIVEASGKTTHSSDNPNAEGVVGRMGGEEFAVILVDCPIENAHIFVDRVREAFANLRVKTDSGEDVGTTLSIGGTEYHHGESYKTTWKRADDLLYDAKKEGRNRAVIK